MRPVTVMIGGQERRLRLTLSDLDEIAAVEPDFLKIINRYSFNTEWDYRVDRAILSAAFRSEGPIMARFVEERGVIAAHELAGRIFIAAMTVEEPEGNGEAVVDGEAETQAPGASASPDTSATA